MWRVYFNGQNIVIFGEHHGLAFAIGFAGKTDLNLDFFVPASVLVPMNDVHHKPDKQTCHKLRSVPLCVCVRRSHVMRELIETERIYVEELLSVLLVRTNLLLLLNTLDEVVEPTDCDAVAGLQGGDGKPTSGCSPAACPARKERRPLRKHA